MSFEISVRSVQALAYDLNGLPRHFDPCNPFRSDSNVHGLLAGVFVTSINNLRREGCLPFAWCRNIWWRNTWGKSEHIGFNTRLLLLPFLVLLFSIRADVGGASADNVSFIRHSLTINLL